MPKLTLALLVLAVSLSWTGAASAQFVCTIDVSGSPSSNTGLYVEVRAPGGSVCTTTDMIPLPSGSPTSVVVDSILVKWDETPKGGCAEKCKRNSATQFQIEANTPFTVWLSNDGSSYTQLSSMLVIDGVTYMVGVNCGVPALSGWGMIVLALVAVAGGGIFLRRLT